MGAGKKRRRQFDRAFKLEAVELAAREGRTVAEGRKRSGGSTRTCCGVGAAN